MQTEVKAGVATLVIEADEPLHPGFPALSPERAIEEADLSPGAPLLVDLSGVRGVRSNLFGYLARLKSALEARRSSMVVLVVHDELYHTMDMLGLWRLFTVVRNGDDALRACGRPRP